MIYGGKGDDRLFGGKGSDEFVFEAQTGNDKVMDFEAGQDTLSISGVMINGTEATVKVLAGRAYQSGKDTVVDLEPGNSITLAKVSFDDFHTHPEHYFSV
ncbi:MULTISPECIES: M10 family metallopeptidase C-terminal domain-containing protein [Mesorhizobium]|uniref:Peptidase M10 serralysin C-terminal domain-containing protein n=1 Tax=Mesorhizobium erdmanii TaxID=1777866 RepID=A0A6M7UQT8_9HYPH|nr:MULTISPECIES: hypothetical protein [Mesorhizobium]QKC79374.1 hypothetical protein EB233_31270 [Mesorhizobium erdmanii]